KNTHRPALIHLGPALCLLSLASVTTDVWGCRSVTTVRSRPGARGRTGVRSRATRNSAPRGDHPRRREAILARRTAAGGQGRLRRTHAGTAPARRWPPSVAPAHS